MSRILPGLRTSIGLRCVRNGPILRLSGESWKRLWSADECVPVSKFVQGCCLKDSLDEDCYVLAGPPRRAEGLGGDPERS